MQFLKDKIESGEVLGIRCMDPSCKIVPSRELLQQILGDTVSDVTASVYEDTALEDEVEKDGKNEKPSNEINKSEEKEENAKVEPIEPTAPETLVQKYDKYLTSLFVEHNSDYRFCPKEGCSRICYIPSNWPEDYVDCMSCHFRFCCKCPSGKCA